MILGVVAGAVDVEADVVVAVEKRNPKICTEEEKNAKAMNEKKHHTLCG